MVNLVPIGWKNGQPQRLSGSEKIDKSFIQPSTTADIADSTDKRYVTEAEKTKLSDLSGTNTGDQNSSTVLLSTALPEPHDSAQTVQEALASLASTGSAGDAPGMGSGRLYYYEDMRAGTAFRGSPYNSTLTLFSIFQGSAYPYGTAASATYNSTNGAAFLRNSSNGNEAKIGLQQAALPPVSNFIRLRVVVSYYQGAFVARKFFGFGSGALGSPSNPVSGTTQLRSAYFYSDGNSNWRVRKQAESTILLLDIDTGIPSSSADVLFDLEIYVNKITYLATFTIRDVVTKSVLWTGDVPCADLTNIASNGRYALRSEAVNTSNSLATIGLLALELEGE